MQVVTARDFRANQRKYFEIAEKEPVFVMRRGARPISISVVNEDDMLSADVLQSIRQGLDDIKHGRVYKLNANETFDELLNRVGNV